MAEFKYDHVVVGAGISGLTSAALLARDGKKVLLIEKAPAVGGSMVRFSLNGIPFETGFHFTGGLAPGGLLHDMLKVLGVDEAIQPLPFSGTDGTRFVFEDSGHSFNFACDRTESIRQLKEQFPEESDAFDAFFMRLDAVCDATTSMNLRTIGEAMHLSDDDYVSLETVLDELFKDDELKAMLAGYCLCYGVSPNEISFANHARMVQGMHDGIVTVEGGGDAFVAAIKKKLDEYGVEIRCKTTVTGCEEMDGVHAGAFRLSNGDLVRFDSAVFTIHPGAVIDLLPPEKLRPAFVKRVKGLKPSFGFMALFAVCDSPDLLDDFILLGMPGTELNEPFEAGHPEQDSMLFCISGAEDGVRTLTVLEAAPTEDWVQWADSSLKKRPDEYEVFKARKTARMLERITSIMPETAGHIQVLDGSTPLTFRDYLHSPDGSAYGVKQLIGQFNLLGTLPVRNLYAAGQSSVLPGVMGAMVSSFYVCRLMQDGDEFDVFINERLDT